MSCGDHFENVRLQLGDYNLKSHMLSIDMGHCDIVLGVEWLCMLGHVTMDFKELYVNFTDNSHTYTLKGL